MHIGGCYMHRWNRGGWGWGGGCALFDFLYCPHAHLPFPMCMLKTCCTRLLPHRHAPALNQWALHDKVWDAQVEPRQLGLGTLKCMRTAVPRSPCSRGTGQTYLYPCRTTITVTHQDEEEA